jgi:hypothetical protein
MEDIWIGAGINGVKQRCYDLAWKQQKTQYNSWTNCNLRVEGVQLGD